MTPASPLSWSKDRRDSTPKASRMCSTGPRWQTRTWRPSLRPLFYIQTCEVSSLEPARPIHVDYTSTGLRRTARECRRDIAEMAKEALAAEDAHAKGEDVTVPRYAAYSVWRPVKTVKRDPLAVCDYRTLDKSELVRDEYRAISEGNPDGEYMMEYWAVLPPKDPSKVQYYWMPEQNPDEVLILKFADTAADTDSNIAMCCAHGSPAIPGTEDEEPRRSIECRVLAFW